MENEISKTEKLVGSAAVWESGELGRDIGHAQRASHEAKVARVAQGQREAAHLTAQSAVDMPKKTAA